MRLLTLIALGCLAGCGASMTPQQAKQAALKRWPDTVDVSRIEDKIELLSCEVGGDRMRLFTLELKYNGQRWVIESQAYELPHPDRRLLMKKMTVDKNEAGQLFASEEEARAVYLDLVKFVATDVEGGDITTKLP